MLGLSTGEVALIALVGFAAFGPKDVPVMARAAGRMAGRAVGFLFAARNRITSFADRTELTQLHMEVQEAMSQLETIRRDLRHGVSILHPPLPPPPHPFPPSQATAFSSSPPDALNDPRPLPGTQDHNGQHEPPVEAFGSHRRSVLVGHHEHGHDPLFFGHGNDQDNDNPPYFVDGHGRDRTAAVQPPRPLPPPSSLPFAVRGALSGSDGGRSDLDSFGDAGGDEAVWPSRLDRVGEEGRARPAEVGAGARLPNAADVARAGSTASWRPTEWELSVHAHNNETGPSLPSPLPSMPTDGSGMVRRGSGQTGGEEHVLWRQQQQGWSEHERQLQQLQRQQQQQRQQPRPQLEQEGKGSLFVLPVSAVAAGLAPKRAGPCSGSDILSDAMVEARVARQAQHFLQQQQRLQQQQPPPPPLPTRPQGQAPE